MCFMTFLHLHVLLKKEKKSSPSNAKNVNLQDHFLAGHCKNEIQTSYCR